MTDILPLANTIALKLKKKMHKCPLINQGTENICTSSTFSEGEFVSIKMQDI